MSFLFLNDSVFACLFSKETKNRVWNCRGGRSREDLGGVEEGNMVINILFTIVYNLKKQNKTKKKELIDFYT